MRSMVQIAALALAMVALTMRVETLWPQAAPAPKIPVRIYTVTTPATFPVVTGGKVLVFCNGVFQSPGIDYTLTASGGIIFKAGFLAAGDQVEVATLP
jgi:hypothetical protein